MSDYEQSKMLDKFNAQNKSDMLVKEITPATLEDFNRATLQYVQHCGNGSVSHAIVNTRWKKSAITHFTEILRDAPYSWK